jgi:hypothetical protein
MTTKSFQIKSIFFILLLLATTCFNSCSKDSDEDGTTIIDNKDVRLIGTWKYEEFLDFSTNVVYKIQFNADGTGSEKIFHKNLNNQETLKSNLLFTWSTNTASKILTFKNINNNIEQSSDYLFPSGNRLIISMYNFGEPFLIKQ